MKSTLVAVAVTAALFSGGAFAQAAAPASKAAPKAAAAAPAAEKQLYSQAQYDVLLKERLAQGGQDTPEIRNAVHLSGMNERLILNDFQMIPSQDIDNECLDFHPSKVHTDARSWAPAKGNQSVGMTFIFIAGREKTARVKVLRFGKDIWQSLASG